MKRGLVLALFLCLLGGKAPARDSDRARELRSAVADALREIGMGPGDLRVRDLRLWGANAERWRESGKWGPQVRLPEEEDPLRPRMIDRALRHPLSLVDIGTDLAEGRTPRELAGLLGDLPVLAEGDLVTRAIEGLARLDAKIRKLIPHRRADPRLRRWMLEGMVPGDLFAARREFDRLGKHDFRPLAREGLALIRALRIPGDPPEGGWPLEKPRKLETPHGTVILGTPEMDVYKEDAWLIIDPGGDDWYRNNAGGTRGKLRSSMVLDLSGNDSYTAHEPFSQGSGYLGVGILVDLDGNDRYRAENFAQGSALGGVGLLFDGGGQNNFIADQFVQGAAAFGVAKLTTAGRAADRYRLGRMGQGFGRTAGYGILEDNGGDDAYGTSRKYPSDYYSQWTDGRLIHWTWSQGCGFGFYCRYDEPDGRGGRHLVTRGMFPGGVGVLVDRAGNDRYNGSMYSQGTGYFYGLGILVDQAGNDLYWSTWYGQGAAPHFAAGLLVDAAGDDAYVGMHQVQGNGRDFSAGVFLDLAGDDRYIAEDRVQGCGDHSDGYGIFIDAGGNDNYLAERATGRGFATSSERKSPYHDVGIFLDLGGKDIYRGPALGADGTIWVQEENRRGVGVDR